MSYAPAIRASWRAPFAAAEQSFAKLSVVVDELLRAGEPRLVAESPVTELAIRKAEKQRMTLLSQLYEVRMAANAAAQSALWEAIKRSEQVADRLALSQAHRLDYLRAARAKQRTHAHDELRKLREACTQRLLRQQSERTTTRELCARRRAAVVGAAAPVAPPAVMVSNYSGVALAM